jgi:hypothetical protein
MPDADASAYVGPELAASAWAGDPAGLADDLAINCRARVRRPTRW